MRRLRLAACMTLAVLALPAQAAADGTVTVGAGSVAVNASADVRCDDPAGGDVERPIDGDDTAPYSASVSADVSVPCQHAGTADQHTATGEASASGSVTSGRYGTVINASGSVSAAGHHFFEASGFAEFSQEFTVVGGPVNFQLSGEGHLELDGGPPAAFTGTLQPGVHTVRVWDSCSATEARNCDPRALSLTLLLGVPEDSDGDALFDVWETEGIDEDGDGTFELDLPAMGADPEHKDLFLEIDRMTGHALSQTAIDQVVAAFAAAPVGNPDGTGGITLHVDNGPTSRMDPTTGAAWGSESDADELTHQPVLGTMSGSNYVWDAFDALKSANFRPERANAFRYVISAHRIGSAATSSSGIARGFGASDLIVSLGMVSEPAESSGSIAQQAGTLMHELGHTLGLHHGGDDDGNYEPNHLSVMNYAFQFTGVPRVDGTDVLGYSRLAIDLDERALSEDVGFGFAAGTEPAEWLTIFRCPDRSRRWAFLQASLTDWNCDGTSQGVVSRELNGLPERTPLVPFLEWPALIYNGGAIGGAGAAAPPDETELIEPPVDELLENAAAVAQAHAESAAGPRLKPPGGSGPPGGGGGAADEPPVLSGLTLSPRSFEASRRGGSTGSKGPARLRFTASRAGSVTFTVMRSLPGRRAGGRCVAPRRGNRGRRCRRLVTMRGSFSMPAVAGANGTRFTGRLRGRALPAGDYQLLATPFSAQQRLPGTARRVTFRILRRGR